jgi:hypothetical protein
VVYSRAEREFLLEHSFASKSFAAAAAVLEGCSSAYPGKDVQSKTVHLLLLKFLDTESFYL